MKSIAIRLSPTLWDWRLLCLSVAVLVVQATSAMAQALPGFADLAERVSPAVVNITTTTVIEGNDGPQGIVPEGSPFEDFFREFQDRGPNRGPRQSSALGSGFVISPDGFIVTNDHVIEDADEILVEFLDGTELPAEIIGRDAKTDIAVLKVAADAPLPFVSFGDSDQSRVGDWVMAIGNPLGQGFSVSAGIISARNRSLSGAYDDFIQTDAAINRGNSGGPLFNLEGEVIGVNTAILSPSGGSIGIGFSMASNVVTRVVDQLQEFGETRRGWLGVRIQDLTPDLIEGMEGVNSTKGALVSDVPDGPAKDGGMEAGDVILTFDGHDIDDVRDLVQTVGNAPVGKTVPVLVIRNGKEVTLNITLGRRETAEMAQQNEPPESPRDAPVELTILDITVTNLSDDIRDGLGLDRDETGIVVVNVEDNSAAFDKGLRSGDLIVEAAQGRLNTVQDFEDVVKEATEADRKTLLLLVRRDGNPRFIALPLK